MNAPVPVIPEVGVVYDLPNEIYHSLPSLSKSQLADFMVLPENYYWKHLDPDRPPREETVGQRSGTLLHTLVLEPHTFKDRYAVGPDVSRATKAWKEWEATLPRGVCAIKPDEFVAGQKQAERLRAHPEVAEILSSGVAEASVFWIDEETGLHCRCRPDWLHDAGHGWIALDLKTGPAGPFEFGGQCFRMSYDMQDAMYSEGIERATGKPVLAFLFGVVETTYPYLASCGALDDESRASGRSRFRRTIRHFAECKARNVWPGYEGVQTLSLPRYAIEQE